MDGAIGYTDRVSTAPESEPVPAPPTVERRVQQIRAVLSAVATVALLAGAGVAFAADLVFVPVGLVVLGVFAGVDLIAALSRLRR